MGRFSKPADIKSDSATTLTEDDSTMSTDVDFDDDFDLDEVVEVEDAEAGEDSIPADTEAEPEPDISSFVEQVESIITRDAAGDLEEITPADIAAIQLAYKALTRKEKNLAKNALSTLMESAVMEDNDIELAKIYMQIQSRMVEAVKVAGTKKTSTPKVVDPTEAWVKLIAKLDLARALIRIPEDLNAEDIEQRATDLFNVGVEDVKKDEPELVWVKQALTLAQPKRAGGFPSGRKRHSVANHIAEAFEGLKSGESLTVDQIVNFKSKEYGDDPLTRQAVIAHLSSKKFQAASSVSLSEDEDGTVLTKK